MNLRALFLSAATIALVGSVSTASAHCGPPHRHYYGKVYYLTGSVHYPSLWCDDCGTLWSYGEAVVDRAYRVERVNPVNTVTETKTTTRKSTRTRTVEK